MPDQDVRGQHAYAITDMHFLARRPTERLLIIAIGYLITPTLIVGFALCTGRTTCPAGQAVQQASKRSTEQLDSTVWLR